MSVNNILLPDLATDLALIATLITGIESRAEPLLEDFLNPRFILKSSADCSTFYLNDVTDYNEVSVVDPANVTINVTFIYRDECGDLCICPSQPMANGGRLQFENTEGDGEYCTIIDITYIDPDIPTDIHTSRIERCVTQKCCNNNMITLRENISCTMDKIGCSVNAYKKIGRSTTKMLNNYLKLSNMLWMIDNSNRSCRLYEVLNCLYKKI